MIGNRNTIERDSRVALIKNNPYFSDSHDSNLVRQLDIKVDRNPSPGDYDNIRKWNGDISAQNPLSYLDRLTTSIYHASG